MRRRITDDDLAFALELKSEYGWGYERIAEFVGCKPSVLKFLLELKLNED